MSGPDWRSGPNPYDFANPVADRDLFAGRSAELEEIAYYLNQAAAATRPINLALLGPRAAGKTSLLNMCELEARRRGLLPVRINLDEGDVQSQLIFFFKLLDAIIVTSVRQGAFGGEAGKTFDTYLEMVSAYSIPEERAFCPFLFPLQYAKALAAGNAGAPVSDTAISMDLSRVQAEVGRPIVLLVDEANALSVDRILLEKVRNLFMNIPGYMLILTGTPTLFPMMDEVFSPIVRQFKRITIGGFADRGDTADCIRKPLERGSISTSILGTTAAARGLVDEIHHLSGGRPYEIQLICHKLFRRLQQTRGLTMRLELTVLDDILREFETSQDVGSRPLLRRVRSMSQRQLAALNLLSMCDAQAEFDQIWTVEYLDHGESQWDRGSLRAQLDRLIDEGVLNEEGGLVRFAGDDFDRIYAKYYCREKSGRIGFLGVKPEFWWRQELITNLNPGVHARRPASIDSSQDDDTAEVSVAALGDGGRADQVFIEQRALFLLAYHLFAREFPAELIRVLRARVAVRNLRAAAWIAMPSTAADPDPGEPAALRRWAARAVELGGEMAFKVFRIQTPDLERLAGTIDGLADQSVKRTLAGIHMECLVERYTQQGRDTVTDLHARLAIKYDNLRTELLNPLGYYCLAAGDIARSSTYLTETLARGFDGGVPGLVSYNLAVAKLVSGELTEARRLVAYSLSSSAGSEIAPDAVLCLLVPRWSNGSLKLEEVRYPDIGKTALELARFIDELADAE